MKNLKFSGLVVSSHRRSLAGAVWCLMAMALLTLSGGNAKSAVLGTYDFDSPTEVPTAANVTFGQFSRTAVGSAGRLQIGNFRSTDWTTTGAQDINEYVQFIVTPGVGYSLNVEQVQFTMQNFTVLGTTGPANGSVSIFANSDLVNAVATQTFTPTTTATTVTFDFADFNSGVGQGVTVRFYGWNAGGVSGSMAFDDVAFSATPVPEPVNVALGVFGAGIGFVSLGGWFRKRKSAAKNA